MLSVSQLTKRFGRDVLAVDGVSFEVAAGEVLALLGPNGAGKTTTLRMVLGLLPPTSGDATIQGISVRDDPLAVRRALGLVSASAGLYSWLSPRELLEYCAALYRTPRPQVASRIAQVSELLDLGTFIDRRCALLSTGQRQRVTMARALLHDPPVVLLDEPTRGLDIVGCQVVYDYLARLKALGKAVVLCTHQLDEAERVCDRFGLLHRGQMRYLGPLADLKAQTGCDRVAEIFLRMLETPESAR